MYVSLKATKSASLQGIKLAITTLKNSKFKINKFIAKRNEYRNNKEFSTADFMRNQLEEVGIVIEDGNESGWRWKNS